MWLRKKKTYIKDKEMKKSSARQAPKKQLLK